MSRFGMWIAVIATLVGTVGCSSGPPVPLREHPVPNPEIQGEITREKAEDALRLKVTRRLEYLNENQDEFKEEVVRTYAYGKNYFYRYYDVFPAGPGGITMVIEPNPRTGPQVMLYEAKVTYPRERYETLYANRPTGIGETEQFVRDRGVQIEHYKFLGDTWKLQHATFEIEETALWRDEAWSPVSRRLRRVEPIQQESMLERLGYWWQDLRGS